MAKKTKNKVFNSVEEYRLFYSKPIEKVESKGSKYYRIGAKIAKMACEKAINHVEPDSTMSHANRS